MEVNFLSKKPWRFPVWYFFSVVLSKICISAFGSSSSPFSSLVILLIIHPFLFVFWLPYFSRKLFGFCSIQLFVCFSVISFQLLIDFSFIVLEWPLLSVLFDPLCISLIFLLSPVLSGLFPQVPELFFSSVAFSFPFLHIPTSFLCFIILACFHRFCICVSSWNSNPGFDFSSAFFRRFQFSRNLLSLLQRLVHLIWLYYSLIYIYIYIYT